MRNSGQCRSGGLHILIITTGDSGWHKVLCGRMGGRGKRARQNERQVLTVRLLSLNNCRPVGECFVGDQWLSVMYEKVCNGGSLATWHIKYLGLVVSTYLFIKDNFSPRNAFFWIRQIVDVSISQLRGSSLCGNLRKTFCEYNESR